MTDDSGHIGKSHGEFNVVQWFRDETYEYVRRGVGPEEAVRAAQHYSSSVGARLGTTQRVIIEDGGGFTNFEWRFGQGITYPPRDELPAVDASWFKPGTQP